MKTLLVGYYGYSNAGDDAFVKVTQWATKEYKINTSLSLTSNTAFTSEYGRVSPIYTKYIPDRFEYKYREYRYKRVANKFDLNLFCGGSNFHTFGSLNLWKNCFKKKGRQIVCGIGVSIGPFKNVAAELECKELLKYFDLLTVRDSTSYDRISSMNIDINYHKTNDLGVLISKACEPNIINCVRQSYNEDIIGFSLCNFERHSNGDTNKEVARNNYVCNLIKEILANNVSQKILLLCFNSNKDVGDRALCQNLISQMPEYKDRLLYYEYDGNLNNMAMTIKKMRCLIGMRLHSIVFAYSLNVPLLMLPYHEKCIEFSKMINLSANQIINYESQSIQSILSILCEKLPTLDNNKSMAEATLNYLYLREVLL